MDPQVLQDLCQQSQQAPLLIFAWTLLGAAILITALRLFSKSKQCCGITADDYVALASTILAAIAVSFLTVWIHFGLGRHVQCLSDPKFTLLWSFLAQVVNIMGVCLVKISVSICVLRVLDSEPRLLRSSIWLLIIFISASHTAHIVFLFLQCMPMDAIWYASVQGAKCFTQQQLSLVYYIGYALEASTDLFCASIPLAVICRLHISNRARIALCVLMGFGMLMVGCAVAKTITISGAWTTDFTWESVTPTWFTIAEHYGGIVLASIPCLAGLLAPSVKSNPSLYGVEGAGNGSLHSVPRKGSAWTLATPRIPLPGVAKKHFSISTFGMSEGEEGSRLTLVENRLTVVGEDEDRLTCVAEEGENDLERATLDTQSVRTATLKGGWNQEDVFGMGILGKDDTFGKEGSIGPRADTSASSIYSVGRVTRPSTPKAMTVSTQPTTPKSAPRPSSRSATPKSPHFPRMSGTPKMPGTPKLRQSVASSIYSDPPASAGLATIPSPPASAQELPTIIEPSSRPTTPKTPKTLKTPAWTVSPSGFTTPKGSRTPTGHGSSTPTGSGSRTPKGSSTPRDSSRPGTPKRSISIAVPVSKFRAEISDEVATEVKKVGKFSDLEMEKGKSLPRPPLEIRVVDIPKLDRFDPCDTSY